MSGELSATSDPAYVRDRSQDINALPEAQSQSPALPADPVPSVQQASQRALAELYRWFDTDDRFTRRLDAIAAYIMSLEMNRPAKVRAKRGK